MYTSNWLDIDLFIMVIDSRLFVLLGHFNVEISYSTHLSFIAGIRHYERCINHSLGDILVIGLNGYHVYTTSTQAYLHSSHKDIKVPVHSISILQKQPSTQKLNGTQMLVRTLQ